MSEKKIVFIINQISGKGNNEKWVELIRREIGDIPHEIHITKHVGHAEEIAKHSHPNETEAIVAFGGDGTLHEIINGMDFSTPLGIVPVGSGNGVARHLKIPLHPKLALRKALSKEKIVAIDILQMNGRYCISNLGLGLDASIISTYTKGNKRGLGGYILATLKTLNKLIHPKVEIWNGKEIATGNFLMINVANANQIGYDFSFSPKADLQDGQMDILCVYPPKNLVQWGRFVFAFLTKKLHNLEFVHIQRAQEITINLISPLTELQVDGERFRQKGNTIEIKVLKQKLRVIL